MTRAHQRTDRCPGITRPWIAEDGALLRIRLVGGQLADPAGLLELAQVWGDGALHLTNRANVQIRGVQPESGGTPAGLVDALSDLDLMPSFEHDRVRNIMMSPLTGLVGGAADVRPVAAEIDEQLRARSVLAELPGKFLFLLDDGRGDVITHPSDIALMALDDRHGQLRIGNHGWGETVRLDRAAGAMVLLAEMFCVRARSSVDAVPWHVDELDEPLAKPMAPAPGALRRSDPPPFGRLGPAEHVHVADGRLTDRIDAPIVVTPWKSIVVPA